LKERVSGDEHAEEIAIETGVSAFSSRLWPITIHNGANGMSDMAGKAVWVTVERSREAAEIQTTENRSSRAKNQ
jgi:hypothetical protein